MMASNIMTEERNSKMSDETLYRGALQAMENGIEEAKTKVAFFKISGRGGAEVDLVKAISLLEERVKGGDGEAMWILGLCCEYGIGMPQDIKQANVLFSHSRDTNNAIGKLLAISGECGRGSGVMRMRSLSLIQKSFLIFVVDDIKIVNRNVNRNERENW